METVGFRSSYASSTFTSTVNNLMAAFSVFFIGGFTGLCLYGQVLFFQKLIKSIDNNDSPPVAISVAIFVAAITVLGCMMWGFVQIFDPYLGVSFLAGIISWIALIMRSLVVAVAICLQAIFAPISCAILVSNTVYHWVTYGDFEWIPVFSELISWLLDVKSPMFIGFVYKLAATGISFSGIIESILDL